MKEKKSVGKKETKGERREEETKGEEEMNGEGREEYDWKYVLVIAELKCVKNLMELNSRVLL